jgi:branched-chain amino acid transport system permease protein
MTPFVVSGTKAINAAAHVCIFVVLAASFDLLLGYTGIVSFAHTMFFGIGAYGVAISLVRIGPTWTAVLTGVGAALVASLVLSSIIGLFSLRVRTTFYAMITLAVAVAFQALALQFSDLTGGGDGITASMPRLLSPAFSFGQGPVLGTVLNGRLIAYYVVLTIAVILFLLMLRIVSSPFGRVLQAIRENDFRAEALGYRVVVYKTLSNVIAASFATMAGVLLTLWVRYTSPSTSLSLEIMLYVLLMVVIGGMGTLYGAVVGATLFVVVQSYLQDLIGFVGRSVVGLPVAGGVLSAVFSPARWLLWLGVLFVIAVCFFPAGIVGELRRRGDRGPTAEAGGAP